MRVIAGIARGQRLETPRGTATRPTSDRVRESIFNALGSLGVVEGASVVDLFAGSGALGIEALSRGAQSCVFVDRDRDALASLRSNLSRVGLESASVVRQGDVVSMLGSLPAADIVFLDPPYAFDGWGELLDRLDSDLVVIESDREIDPGAGWEVIRQRSYGGTVVTFAKSVDLGAHNHTGVSP